MLLKYTVNMRQQWKQHLVEKFEVAIWRLKHKREHNVTSNN